MGTIIFLTSQLRKLGHREVKKIAQSHVGSKQQIEYPNLGSLVRKPALNLRLNQQEKL